MTVGVEDFDVVAHNVGEQLILLDDGLEDKIFDGEQVGGLIFLTGVILIFFFVAAK